MIGAAGMRRGEWLELTPGKAIQGTEDKAAAIRNWLMITAEMPEKLIRRLEASGEIKSAGDRLRLRLFPPRDYGFKPGGIPPVILYEDDYCLVVHKEVGIKVHPDGADSGVTLANAVAHHYQLTGQQVAVRHIHRLDEHTSGPVLYAKNELSQLKLDDAMTRKEIGRIYVAWVQGIVPSTLKRIDAPIGRDRHNSKRQRVTPGGKPAITYVELVHAYPTSSLVRLTLETGRTHQIRVHMSYAGYPLIGDSLYGASERMLSYQALHGESLAFEHPMNGENIQVNDPWPEELLRLDDRLK